MSQLRKVGHSGQGTRRAGTARVAAPAPALALQRLAGNRATSALLTGREVVPPSFTAGELLTLQRGGGNRAVQALVEPPAAGPADVNVGFNAMDRMHRLLIAIDQKQVDIHKMTRHVDFDATVAALSDMTADQAREVMDAYLAHEGRTLYNDLFGLGESGFHSDLAFDQLMRIDALLSGTRAAGRSEAEVRLAAEHQLEADAAELHALLHGELEEVHVERVMALIRRPADGNERLADTYTRVVHEALRADLARLGVLSFLRAQRLLMGDAAAAAAFQLDNERARIRGIDARVAELREDPGSLAGVTAFAEIRILTEERKHLVEVIERRLHEGGAQALGAAGVAELATAIGGTDAAVVRAESSGDPVERVAAQLRKASAADDLSAEQLTAALRGLRAAAEAQAARELRGASPDEVAARAKTIAEGFFTRLRPTFDQLAGGARTLDQLLAETGDEGDVRLNQSLMREQGRLGDLDELVLALAGDRKDVATVERVLRNKSAPEIAELQEQYRLRTGKALDRELFGSGPTRAGMDDPGLLGLFDQGKASGTDRLNLEDYLQRPEREGGMEEVTYIVARAEREYQYTIDNRGATGWWRDTWGNEQRELLDETISRVRRLQLVYTARWSGQPEWAHSAEAHQMIQQLRLARATIRGDRTAYEKATAELRATFQAVAAFALQIALTAVLGPVAELALVGELAEGASVALPSRPCAAWAGRSGTPRWDATATRWAPAARRPRPTSFPAGGAPTSRWSAATPTRASRRPAPSGTPSTSRWRAAGRTAPGSSTRARPASGPSTTPTPASAAAAAGCRSRPPTSTGGGSRAASGSRRTGRAGRRPPSRRRPATKPPASARSRTLTEESRAEGDPGLTDVEPGEESILDDPVYELGIVEASDRFARLVNIGQSKTVGSGPGDEVVRSGWGARRPRRPTGPGCRDTRRGTRPCPVQAPAPPALTSQPGVGS